MINTHVLVASHGAGMTNIMFMKQASHVIEIIPFSMYKVGFRRLSRLAGLRYKNIVAEADMNGVETCARNEMLDEQFWTGWKMVLSGSVMRLGKDATERCCIRTQDLRIPETELEAVLALVAARYADADDDYDDDDEQPI
ncbi:hypothetical protein FGB62_356g03 [Gracilaria domingensis]|nr:hypothetical protein FGB62_356g03 [Gracilaria domingensis]